MSIEYFCNTCAFLKESKSFYKRKDGKVDYRCKECHREYKKIHYKKNKQKYLDKANKQRKERQDWFQDLKSKLCCSKCPENHRGTLDFHHKNNDKEFNVASMKAKGLSKERILLEIKKCDILCSNCHRKLHWELKSS